MFTFDSTTPAAGTLNSLWIVLDPDESAAGADVGACHCATEVLAIAEIHAERVVIVKEGEQWQARNRTDLQALGRIVRVAALHTDLSGVPHR